MPNSSGHNRRLLREASNDPPAPSRCSMNDVAAPEIRNSSDNRHGDDNRIQGSSAGPA